MLERITAALMRRHLHRISDGTIEILLECDHGMRVNIPLTTEPTDCQVLPGVYLGPVTIGREGDAA